MATTPEQPPVPQPNPADHHFDEKSGIYGFFRRHQKKILYTVGLFTLLTFSVGGPMLTAVNELFARPVPLGTIEVNGKRVSLEKSDYDYARRITQAQGALLGVLPNLGTGEGGSSDLSDMLAILRRVAITEGIDASYTEVDAALEVQREKSKLQSVAQLANQRGFGSLAELRDLMHEALRIGQFVRLQTLGLDDSDAGVLQQLVSDREKITFKVASFDEKALEESLKKAGGITDDDLKKWLDGKPEPDKNRIGAYDTNRVELKIGAAVLADFDPAEWQDEALKDFKVGDEQLKKAYETEKESRFKVGDTKDYKPFDDEAVKAELTKLLQAEQVMNHLLGRLRESLNKAMEAVNTEQRRTNEDWGKKQNEIAVASQKSAAAKAKVDANAADEAAKAEFAAAEEELRLLKEANVALENARKAAEDAVKAARAAFDFPAEFAALTKDKKGFVQKAFTGKRNADELKDLDAGELGLGQWSLSVYATYLQNKGDLCNMPGKTTKAVVLYQVADVEVRPLKAWDKLKPLLEGAYFTEQAKTQAEAKKKIMEESLLRLAKAKMPEKVAEIEGKRAESVAKKLADWEAKTQEGIASAEKTLAENSLSPETQAYQAWVRKRDSLKERLAAKAEQQKAFEAEVGAQIDADIGTEAKKFHAEVLAGAAADAGFTVTEIGPFSRELSRRPRFDKAFDPVVVYLFQNHDEMKAGESTGMVQDVAKRLWLVGCCTKVEPLQPADVERREYALMRKGGFYSGSYATLQAQAAYYQAFTRAALEKRYAWQPPAAETTPDAPK